MPLGDGLKPKPSMAALLEVMMGARMTESSVEKHEVRVKSVLGPGSRPGWYLESRHLLNTTLQLMRKVEGLSVFSRVQKRWARNICCVPWLFLVFQATSGPMGHSGER